MELSLSMNSIFPLSFMELSLSVNSIFPSGRDINSLLLSEQYRWPECPWGDLTLEHPSVNQGHYLVWDLQSNLSNSIGLQSHYILDFWQLLGTAWSKQAILSLIREVFWSLREKIMTIKKLEDPKIDRLFLPVICTHIISKCIQTATHIDGVSNRSLILQPLLNEINQGSPLTTAWHNIYLLVTRFLIMDQWGGPIITWLRDQRFGGLESTWAWHFTGLPGSGTGVD